jgi:hypothetical protein
MNRRDWLAAIALAVLTAVPACNNSSPSPPPAAGAQDQKPANPRFPKP